MMEVSKYLVPSVSRELVEKHHRQRGFCSSSTDLPRDSREMVAKARGPTSAIYRGMPTRSINRALREAGRRDYRKLIALLGAENKIAEKSA